jgi:hypothetical protein
VDCPESLGKGWQLKSLPERLWDDVFCGGNEGIEMAIDQRANDFMTEPFSGRIDRENLSRRERICLGISVRENHVLPGGHLPPVIEPNRPRYQQSLTDEDGAIEEWLPGPDTFEDAAVVPEHGVKDPKPPAGRQHSLGHNPAHTGDLLAQRCPGERRDGGRIYITMGKMPEKIASGANAKAVECFSATVAYPLEELDWGIEANRRWDGASRHPG